MTFPGGLLNDPRLRQQPDASRVQYGPGDQSLFSVMGQTGKAVGQAGAGMARGIWDAVKADPRGVAGTVGKELSGYEDLTHRLPAALKARDWAGAGMAALSALPVVGALGDAGKAGRFLTAHGDDYVRAAQDFAKARPLEAGFVTVAAPEAGERVFLTANGKAGFKLAPNADGAGHDIRGLFNHGNKGDGTVGLVEAVRAGGETLDNYDTKLSTIYDGAGFKVTQRYPFDRAQSTLDPSFGTPDYTLRRLDPEYAAVLRDPSVSADEMAARITAARKQGLDILGRPLEQVTGAAPGPKALQAQIEEASRRVPASAPSVTDTDAGAARAGLLGPTVPPNSVHQAPQSSLVRNTPSTAPSRAKNAGLERAANKALRSPSFDEAINTGKQVQAERWYDTDRLRAMWDAELGAEEGPKAYRRFAQMVAATSPGAQVPINLRRASREYMLDRQGLLAGEIAGGGRREIPGAYAARYQPTNNSVIKGLLDNGEIQSDKAASFAENLTGNYAPATIDRHFLRAFNDALPKSSKFKITGDAPSDLEYGALERAFTSRAAELGMAPAEMQAAWWVGKGGDTNMLSGSASFEEHFAHRVLTTAKELKMDTPEGRRKVAGMFIRGEIPLLGVGAVGAGAALQQQKAPSSKSQGPRGML